MSSACWKPNGEKCPLTKVVNGDGVKIIYEMNGRKQCQGAYVGGLAHGLWTMWPDDGNTRQVGHYKQGKEDGVWRCYNRFGKITHSETWKDGEVIEE
jgi:antitoxin component YwqK of YwqJK toxin-antitoxin module